MLPDPGRQCSSQCDMKPLQVLHPMSVAMGIIENTKMLRA